MSEAMCEFPECTGTRDQKSLGLCQAHYMQRRMGLELRPVRRMKGYGIALARDEAGNKFCTRCDGWYPVTEFQIGRRNADGLTTWCKSCVREYSRSNRETSWAKTLWVGAKRRADEQGLPFDIEISDIEVPDKCPILGIPLVMGKGKSGNDSANLDKIIPALGYVKGNIQVISNKANSVKSDLDSRELLMFADWVYKTFKERDEPKH